MKQKMADCECQGWLGLVQGQSAKRGVVKVEDWRQIVKPDFQQAFIFVQRIYHSCWQWGAIRYFGVRECHDQSWALGT